MSAVEIKTKRMGRKENKRILIVTDGVVTETGYFCRVRDISCDVIDIVPRSSKNTRELINLAINRRDGVSIKYDFVAVVCDVDDKLDTEKSRKQLEKDEKYAKENNVFLCLTNQSFEVWLIAHIQRVPSDAGERKKASNIAKQLGIVTGKRGKVVVANKIDKNTIRQASDEAKRLRKVYGSNIMSSKPITYVDVVIDIIKFV